MTKTEHDQAERMLWRLATIKVVMFSVLSLLTCWMTATQGLDMTRLSTYELVQTIIGCICAWLITMVAFIDKSASQVSTGKIPGLENGSVAEPDRPAPVPPAPTPPTP